MNIALMISCSVFLYGIAQLGIYWNWVIIPDGDMGTKKEMIWSFVIFMISIIQLLVVTIIYKPS